MICKIFCAGLNPDSLIYLWCHLQHCYTTVTNTSSHSGIVVDLSHTTAQCSVSIWFICIAQPWMETSAPAVCVRIWVNTAIWRSSSLPGSQTAEQVTSLVENLTPETELIRKLKIQWEKQDNRFTPPSCAPQSTCALIIAWLKFWSISLPCRSNVEV